MTPSNLFEATTSRLPDLLSKTSLVFLTEIDINKAVCRTYTYRVVVKKRDIYLEDLPLSEAWARITAALELRWV